MLSQRHSSHLYHLLKGNILQQFGTPTTIIQYKQRHSESHEREAKRTDPYGPQKLATQEHQVFRQQYLCLAILQVQRTAILWTF